MAMYSRLSANLASIKMKVLLMEVFLAVSLALVILRNLKPFIAISLDTMRLFMIKKEFLKT